MSLSRPVDDGLFSAGHRALTIGLVLTITLVAFEALAVSTIMPIVARDLGRLELYGWVFTAFMLGSLIGIIGAGGLIDRRGLALPFALGLGLFAVGLVGGGLASSMEMLVGARFLQGLGAGTIQPIAYVAIGRSLSERQRPRMFAMLSTAWVLPGVLGPAIAGVVAELAGWRIVFLGLLPLIAVAALLALPAVARVVGPASGGADSAEHAAAVSLRQRLPLALVLAAGTGILLTGLGSEEPPLVVGLTLIGLLMATPALVRLTPRGTLRAARGVPTAVLIRGVSTFAFFAVDAYVALALVEWRGLSVVEAGISLTAATVTWTAGSWVQARASQRIPPDRFITVGLAILTVGLVLAPEVPAWIAVPTIALAGLGMGLAYSPMALIVLKMAAPGAQGAASSALSLSDSLGTALGTGLTGAFVALTVRGGEGPAPGLAAGIGVAAAVAALGVALSPRLRPTPASAAIPAGAQPPRATPTA
jgi:MFS family permease